MREKLIKIIRRVLPDLDVSTVTNETRLVEDLGLESLEFMILFLGLEMEFGITEMPSKPLYTVQDVINYIEEQTQNKGV